MRLPSGKFVTSNTPIYSGSNFTWGEVTKNCTRPLEDLYINGRLVATKHEIETRIIGTAHHLDNLRKKLGNRPIFVNSWYRPASINSSISKATWSRHQFGDGVDIRTSHLSAEQMYQILDPIHKGGLGKYRTHVHIDNRGKFARW